MNITKVHIENFKTFKGSFKFILNQGVNILVGDNEAGKSTIIEAIHLALTGLHNGKYLKNELTQYVFNKEVVAEYIQCLEEDKPAVLPKILIEIFIEGEDTAEFEGDGSLSEKGQKVCGFSFKVEFDELNYRSEYENLVKMGGIKTLPIEYYNVSWSSFARDESITTRTKPHSVCCLWPCAWLDRRKLCCTGLSAATMVPITSSLVVTTLARVMTVLASHSMDRMMRRISSTSTPKS